jgi:hypothetical protein
MSTDDGKVIGDLPIAAGVDATRWDGHQAFASTREGKLSVAEEKGGKWEIVQTVTTGFGVLSPCGKIRRLRTGCCELYLSCSSGFAGFFLPNLLAEFGAVPQLHQSFHFVPGVRGTVGALLASLALFIGYSLSREKDSTKASFACRRPE